MMNQQDREILRQRVIGYLATRQQLQFEAGSIKRSLVSRQNIDFEVSDSDIDQALIFGEGLEFVEHTVSEVGATIYWKATSKAVLEAERNGWNV